MKIFYSQHAPLPPNTEREEITVKELLQNSEKVAEIEAEDAEDAFQQMQAEIMDSEIKENIQNHPFATHTSMCPGDFIIDDDEIYHVDNLGWTIYNLNWKQKAALKAKPLADRIREVLA